MKITRLETFLANAGLRNYLFVRLHHRHRPDRHRRGDRSNGRSRPSRLLLHEWVARRVVGRDPFDIEAVVGGMIRDQYQGGSTVMTAISGVEIALWDLIGKACGQPVYRCSADAARRDAAAYANGWYGGRAHAGAICRTRARRCRSRLPGAEVRPVRHRLEALSSAAEGGARSPSSPRSRGGRPRRRADDRVPRPARRGDAVRIMRAAGPGATSSGARSRSRRSASTCWRGQRGAPGAPIAAGERLYAAGGLLPAARAARRRRGADGPRPLRRPLGGQEDRGDRPGAGHARRAALLDRPGRPGRGAALRLSARRT